MSRLNEFSIPYLGLSDGTHNYTFEIESSFFAQFEKSKVGACKFDMKVEVLKDGRMIVLLMTCSGTFQSSCDRCMSLIDVPLSFADKAIIKVEEKQGQKETEVYYLDPSISHIDLSPYLYEAIHLNLPLLNLRECENEEYKYCDHDALDMLDGGNQPEEEEEKDNVWKVLDDLKIKKDKD